MQRDRNADKQKTNNLRVLCLEWQWRNVHMTWPR